MNQRQQMFPRCLTTLHLTVVNVSVQFPASIQPIGSNRAARLDGGTDKPV
jgi:hypothetical protein